MLKAPFPYFGSKSTVASKVWHALGDCKHYIEPFFGSGAVLLSRPSWSEQSRFVETVNDKDGFIANVWRSLQFDPGEVAKWCDWPVNHADLSARKKELIKNEERLLENLINNPEWYDPKLAGYWIWAASCWIGAGLTKVNQIPHIGDAVTGVCAIRQRPHIANAGIGVHSVGKRPHVIDSGKGVHSVGQRPHVSDSGKGVHGRSSILDWFKLLSARLRYVRVVCGDWNRVCGGNWQDQMGIVGMYFDPPYGVKDRAAVYHHDSTSVAADVLEWCKERGSNKSYRIVISGYEEYEELLGCGWESEAWTSNGGYGNLGNGNGRKNKHRETLYYSPHCVKSLQRPLFVV